MGNFELAIFDFDKAVKINSGYDRAYNNRGSSYYAIGNVEQAILDYNKAIDINPNNPESLHNRALAFFSKRNYDKAWEDVHKAKMLGIEVDPRFLEKLKKASKREN
jgi:tetratricopeptide (TPR) repeat protein